MKGAVESIFKKTKEKYVKHTIPVVSLYESEIKTGFRMRIHNFFEKSPRLF